jgi:hypothetical protein
MKVNFDGNTERIEDLLFYYGSFEQDNKYFKFAISEDGNDVTWLNEIPVDDIKAEKFIMQNFN